MSSGTDVPARPGEATTSGDGYRIRSYEPSDRRGFLSLYEEVFGRRRTDDWVEWRYGGPYTDRVRMIVAERDGEFVGAEPFISLRMAGGGEAVEALQPADAMVHPEHRGNGLLARMTETALEATAEGDGFFFNFPNASAKPTYLRLGWRQVGETATAYRVHAPSAFADSPGLGAAADRLARGVYGGFDSAVETAADALGRGDVEVSSHDDPPVAVLESLYERRPPDRLHVPRKAEFYRWRLANPNWDVTTYVAASGGEPTAALVVGTEATAGVTYTKLLDALPPVDPDVLALERLVTAAVADHRSSDAVVVAGDTLPRSVRRRLGFLRNDDLPLSLVTSPNDVVARPFSLGGRSWSVGGRRLADREHWELPLVVQDTSL